MTTPGIRRAWRTLRLQPPNVGTDWVLKPGGQRWWRVVSFVALLTTDANVATRVVHFEAATGERVWSRLVVNAGQLAGASVFYTAHTSISQFGILDNTMSVQLPAGGLLIGPGDTFGPVTTLLQVGDQWSALAFRLEEVPQGPDYVGDQLDLPAPPSLTLE